VSRPLPLPLHLHAHQNFSYYAVTAYYLKTETHVNVVYQFSAYKIRTSMFFVTCVYKCIGDDTKAADRQSPNCIKNQNTKIWRKTIFNMADGILTPCNVACGSGIVTVNSPSGSNLQCDTWLWDDMPLNSPKRPPY